MVLEQFLESKRIMRHKLFLFFLGFVYIMLSYVIAVAFFPDAASLATVFIASLLLTPSIYYILNVEEMIEREKGMKHFFRSHKDIFEVFIFLFVGLFLGYVMLGFIADFDNVFGYQTEFLDKEGKLTSDTITDFASSDYSPTIQQFAAVASNNVLVILIAFLLSLFYGVGAVFLEVLNASIFATFISFVIRQIGEAASASWIFLIYLIHLIPELTGFVLAAIAGGVLSRAIVKEKFMSKEFENVVADSSILLFIAFCLILVAAFLEVFVTANVASIII